MEPELIRFALRYQRFLRFFGRLVALFPTRWRPGWVFVLGRYLNPFQLLRDKLRRSIGLVFPAGRVDPTWRDWLDSHVRFVLDFMTYASLDRDWLRTSVRVTEPELLATLRAAGGLLLTYHSNHQNTMCCALGIDGIKISAIAALPEDSPMFPYIGHWAQRVNTDSAKHFNGGAYIFTNNLRTLLQTTRTLLANREVVVCLCDFHQPRPGVKASGRLFDRSVAPPTGAIDIAIKHGAPVFAAMFAPINGILTLELTRLDASDGVNSVIAGYFSFLESNIRSNPACWQGWEWFEDLPFAEQASA